MPLAWLEPYGGSSTAAGQWGAPLEPEEDYTPCTGGNSWDVPRGSYEEEPSAGPSAPPPASLVRQMERLQRRQPRGGPGRSARRRARENETVRVGPDGELIYYDILDENVEIPETESDEELQDAFRR